MKNDFSISIEEKRTFFSHGHTGNIGYRINVLKALRNSIKEHETAIVNALVADFKKPVMETYLTEIVTVLGDIDYYIKNVRRLSRTKPARSSLLAMPSRGKVYAEPYGVVLIISPWNYPFYLTMSPLVAAVAAGNSVVLKPSEFSPNTSDIIFKIIDELFDPSFISVELGGVDVATSLLKNRFDYIFFTGGTRVGKIIMEKAAQNLTPVTLELGGKNPCIVDETADLTLAAKRIVWGKYVNAGQTCLAPDYLLVHSDVKDKLLDLIKAEIVKSYGISPVTNSDLAGIINQGHFDRLVKVIGSGKVVIGGKYDRENLKIEPTVISNVLPGSDADTQEIFGPILTVEEYSELNDVVNTVNSREHPLALYIFSKNKKNVRKVVYRCHFGGGAVNDTVMHIMSHSLPFGGVGNSGMGSYHGKYGFDTFTHYKGVLYRNNKFEIKQKYPPYKQNATDLIKKIFLR